MRQVMVGGSLMFILVSCGSSGEKARSVHVDSSNIEGAAPVRYQGDHPEDTIPRFPVGDDTGKRAHTRAEGNSK